MDPEYAVKPDSRSDRRWVLDAEWPHLPLRTCIGSTASVAAAATLAGCVSNASAPPTARVARAAMVTVVFDGDHQGAPRPVTPPESGSSISMPLRLPLGTANYGEFGGRAALQAANELLPPADRHPHHRSHTDHYGR